MEERINDLRHELHRKIDELFDKISKSELTKPEPTIIIQQKGNEEWLSAGRACELLGISKTTFFVKVKQGDLPKPLYFGARSPRWKMDDIEKFLKNKQKGAC